MRYNFYEFTEIKRIPLDNTAATALAYYLKCFLELYDFHRFGIGACCELMVTIVRLHSSIGIPNYFKRVLWNVSLTRCTYLPLSI